MNKRIEEYQNNPALNQSKLKKLLSNNPKDFFEEKESSGFLFGSAVDCLLTHPEDFDDEYFVYSIDKMPSESIIKICDDYYNIKGSDEIELMSDNNLLYSIIQKNEFGNKTWSKEKLCEQVKQKGLEYYKIINEKGNRTLVTQETMQKVQEVAGNIKNTFPEFFNNDYKMEYQLPLYGKFDDIEIKGLLDMVAIDEKTKTIKIIDIKTTYDNVLNFNYEMKKYRYDIQMAWYFELARQNYPINYVFECYFLVESTSNPGTPVLLKCENEILDIGTFGYNKYSELSILNEKQEKEYKIEGYYDLIEKFRYYNENGFDVPMKIKENNNRLNLSFYDIR